MTNKKSKPEDSRIIKIIRTITTLHGTGHFRSKRSLRLTLWCVLMLGNVLMTAGFIIIIKNQYDDTQMVTRINANCKISQVPFPAVTICNFNVVSLRESANIALLLRGQKVPQQEIEEFLNALPLLKDYNKNSRNVGNFTHIMNILKEHYFTMESVMQEVHQKCENLLVFCTFNRKVKKCDTVFRLVKTFEGYCCVFNMISTNDVNDVFFNIPDEDLEYYDDQNEEDQFGGKIISTTESGSGSGLRVLFNVEPNDYPSWSTEPSYGAKIILTDPHDYPETTLVYRYLTLGETIEIKVEANMFQSEDSIRRMDPDKRGCWFYDEVNLQHTDRYSYETCNTECRMKTYLESCGCIPYKYPRSKEKSSRICELEDLKCLHNVTVYKSNKDMNCQPVCYMECRDKKYQVTSDLVPFLGLDIPKNVTQGYNISQLAELKVYYPKSNINCYKLFLMMDASNFIATYGGIFSLSFGGSILTLLELLFLFCLYIFKKLTTSTQLK